MSHYTPTSIPGICVRASIEWADIGTHLANARSDDQATFLEALAESLRAMGSDGEMQLSNIGDWINDADNMCAPNDILWLLQGIAGWIHE